MNEEIKEILSKDNIHIIECDKNWCNAYGYEKSQMKRDVIKYITILEEKNQRLNNLINELEKYLINESKYDEYKDVDYREAMECALDELKELKEGKELEMTEDEEEYIDYIEDKGDE